MTQSTLPFSNSTLEEQRRRALAKIYSLLIKLAEEIESRATPLENDPKEETVEEPSFTSAPLQDNIPS